ncbi:MAG TPA: HNH endonuclease [Archangium sp.]|nr:HNH endonuclease [Archangium sp.]
MRDPLRLLLAASLLLTACATDGTRRAIRLKTEDGPSRTFVPPRAVTVEVSQAQFDAAMARLVAELELPSPRRQRLALVTCGQSGLLVVQGRFTLTLAPGALAMASQGTNGGGDVPSKHHLPSIESWRKPRFTEDGKILPYKGTRNPPTPITNLGRNRAGQTITDGKNNVRFDKDGFAEFDAKFETILDDLHIGSGRSEQHMRAANKRLFDAIKSEPGLAQELGLSRTAIEQLLTLDRAPRGYIWHHHQDVCRMQLVQEEAHILSRPHTGGMAIWGGGHG